MLSFWEKRSFTRYDHMVVGSGIVGLSTALSLKETHPKSTVLVLERGILPTGASTKNAGFACFGSLTELLEDIKLIGEEKALRLVQSRWEGLQKLRDRLGDASINYQNHGGYELIYEEELNCLDQLDHINQWLVPLFKSQVFEIRDERIPVFGFNDKTVRSMVFNKYEGQIDTGKMMKSLLQLTREMGIEIRTGAEVLSIQEGKDVEITVRSHGQSLSLRAGKVAVCTNAFTRSLFPSTALDPGRGIVLVTKPIQGLKFQGTFHIEQGYYYFRDFEGRVIFGGGRNLFKEEETTTAFEINERIINVLKQKLDNIILPNSSYEIDHAWAGIMAFGRDKQPIVTKHSDRVFLGVRLGGMGVAIGSSLGEQLAEMMGGKG